MPGGAPNGNNNAGKGRDWRDALNYVLAERGREEEGDGGAYVKGLRRVARKFMDAVEKGGVAEFRELGDRIDGKAAQAIDLNGKLDVPMSGTVKIVKSDAQDQ